MGLLMYLKTRLLESSHFMGVVVGVTSAVSFVALRAYLLLGELNNLAFFIKSIAIS